MDKQFTLFIPKILLTTLLFFFVKESMAQNYNPSAVQFIVQQKIETAPDDFHPIYILLEDQINCKAIEASFQQNRISVQQRATQTIQALQQKAASTQTNFLKYLQESDFVKKESIRPFWVANAIFAEVKKEVIAELSHNPKVAWIGHNGKLQLTDTIDEEIPSSMLLEPNSTEPGLLAVNAPALWEMGYSGYGTTVFINDTGVSSKHPAIYSKYSAHYPDASPDFFVHEMEDVDAFDCSDHGTHVLGTTIGLDRLTRDTIGVAYNAHWIGAAILCGLGTIDNISSFQWSLDRDGDFNTTNDIPDVINNSWYDNEMTDSDCTSIYVPIFEAMELAGIAVVFSAGNMGPDPTTITPPHNINIDTVNSFTVAATNVNFPYTVANFSSRGPSKCGGEGSLLIKPEVAAPGVQVRSCVLNGGYGLKSGTSMAAPHTSGVILLLKEAFPSLTGKELKLAIYHTCTDLGDEGEDNTYGMGMINALEAFNYLLAKGHEPVQPIRTNDVVLINALINEIECDSEINPTVIFENVGTDTIYSLDINYGTNLSASSTKQWTGELLPNEQVHLPLDALDATVGKQKFTITLANPNDLPDLRPLNNQLVLPLEVVENEPLIVYVDEGTSICQGSSAVLKTDYTGDGEIQWYDTLSGGNLLGKGNFYETNPLDTFSSFYADIFYNKNVGIENVALSAELPDTEVAGLVFEAYAPFVLKSVKVYHDTGGGREIALLNEVGEKINSQIAFLIGSGETRVDLNFPVSVGAIFYLGIIDGNPLKFQEEDVNFPYTVPQIMSITSGVQDSIPNNNYYYLYDWEIEYYDICGRTEIGVDVSPSDSLLEANFALSTDTINIDLAEVLTLSDLSSNATNILWDFGDGTLSNEANPAHTYTEIGSYFVSQTVWNADACADATMQQIEVIGTPPLSTEQLADSDELLVYPNPTTGEVNIAQKNHFIEVEVLYLYNTTGKLLGTYPFNETSTKINLNHLPNGLYYLVAKGAKYSEVHRIIKQ